MLITDRFHDWIIQWIYNMLNISSIDEANWFRIVYLYFMPTISALHRSQQISARKRKNFATMTDSVCQAHHLHRDLYCFSKNIIKKKRGKHCFENTKWFRFSNAYFLWTTLSRVSNSVRDGSLRESNYFQNNIANSV